MTLALAMLATLCAALFAGAAVYINVAEHPARMRLDTASALRQWAPSYRRATGMQAPLALLSFICGASTWLLGASMLWLLAAILIGLVVPFTFIVVMPTNRRLLEASQQTAAADAAALLRQWNRLHAVRTVLSLAASLLFLWLLGTSDIPRR